VIVDSHCHAWRQWPYQPPVPDPKSRAIVEQLLFEMDQNGVDKAVVICARIDDNPDNNEYVAECVQAYSERLYQFADVDCYWSDTYHAPGAADRLSAAVERYGLTGFTHYVNADDDGAWYLSEEGLAFFQTAERLGQIASMALPVHVQPTVREVARRFPGLTFLYHHMGRARVAPDQFSEWQREITASAQQPNIHVKLSGFHYASQVAWEYPYPDCAPIVRTLYEQFGPERLHWGSDYPVLRRAMTYQQSLEAFRTHCQFVPEADRTRILGDSLYDLLERG